MFNKYLRLNNQIIECLTDDNLTKILIVLILEHKDMRIAIIFISGRVQTFPYPKKDLCLRYKLD